MRAFIDDGYTEDGCIAAVPRLHPELRFQFRPAVAAARLAWWDWEERQAKAKPDPTGQAQARRKAEIIAEHLVGWELAEAITPEQIARLRGPLFDRLFNVVMGFGPGDGPDEAAAKN